MMTNKKDYKEYLKKDKEHMLFARNKLTNSEPIWRFIKILRKCEYYKNCGDNIQKIYYYFLRYRYQALGYKLGY